MDLYRQSQIYILIVLLHVLSTKSHATSGPFKTKMLAVVNHCEDPTYPYEKDPSYIINMYLHNTTSETNLMGGNITVIRSPKNIKGCVKVYMGKSKHPFTIVDNLTCRSVLIQTIARTLGRKLTNINKYCSPSKGTYYFSGIDVNRIEHITRHTMPYGTMTIKSEIRTGKATIACWKCYIATTPAPDKP